MTIIEYGKRLSSLLALAVGLSFASGCPPAGEEGNGNGNWYDGGMPPAEQCLSPQEFAETTIYSSTTICPGTYRNVALKIAGDDITLQGKDVTLDGLLAGGTAIYAEGVSRLAVKGFTLKDYGAGVSLKDVKDSDIEITNYSTVGSGTAIGSERGLAIRITGGELNGNIYISGSSYEISKATIQKITTPNDPSTLNGLQVIENIIGDGMYIGGGGQGYVIKGNKVTGMIHIRNAGNVIIEDNAFQSGGISGEYLTTSTVKNNIVDGGGISVTALNGGSYRESHDVTIESNTVQNCHDGIEIGTSDGYAGRNINLLSNTVQQSNQKGIFFHASDSLLESNIVTENRFGLVMAGCSNTIKNNDLRNNEEGNSLTECSNTYEGNLE